MLAFVSPQFSLERMSEGQLPAVTGTARGSSRPATAGKCVRRRLRSVVYRVLPPSPGVQGTLGKDVRPQRPRGCLLGPGSGSPAHRQADLAPSWARLPHWVDHPPVPAHPSWKGKTAPVAASHLLGAGQAGDVSDHGSSSCWSLKVWTFNCYFQFTLTQSLR